jgi:GxxExxY protein
LTGSIVEAAIEVHRALGPGLLERIYEEALGQELLLRDLSFEQQVPIEVMYKGRPLNCEYQIDMIVQEQVIVEIKSVEKVLPVHQAQIMTYMKLTGKRRGLLLNFNSALMIDGVKRISL